MIKKNALLNITTDQEILRAERKALVETEYNTYSPEHFPGSPKWMAHRNAELALYAFDAAHPEVLATIKAEKTAAPPPEYVTDPNSFYSRALRGED